MPQSLSRVLIHLVFSTKSREPFIAPESRDRVFTYLGGSLNALGCPVIRAGGVADQVHRLFVLSRTGQGLSGSQPFGLHFRIR
jgi:putative transposase